MTSKAKHPQGVAQEGTEDAATWVGASIGAEPGEQWTEELSQRVAESLAAAEAANEGLAVLQDSRGLLEDITARWANIGQGQFAGYLQEFHHRTTFNVDAAEQGSPVHSLITGFEGSHPNPAAPADVLVVDGLDRVLSEVQAKSVASSSQRVMDLAAEKYDGMQLLVPSDHVAATEDFISRRIDQAHPDFLRHEAYDSVQGRLTSTITWQDIHSDPMSEQELQAAATDPKGYFQDLLHDQRGQVDGHFAEASQADDLLPIAELSQIVGASAAGGLTAAGFSLLISGVRSTAQLRAGEVSAAAAAVTAVSQSTSSFVRGAVISGGGQTLRVVADNGYAIDALANGALAFAVARAVWDVGAIGVQLANGDIDSTEAAGRMGTSLLRIGCTYSCMVVGQALIPIPGVGAVVGGAVGALCAATIVQGMAMARVMGDELKFAREELARIEAEVEAAVIVLNAEIQWLEEFTKDQDIAFRQVLLPNLRAMEYAVHTGAFVDALPAITEIIIGYGQRPLFTTMHEFDAWMLDPATRLVIRTNPHQ